MNIHLIPMLLPVVAGVGMVFGRVPLQDFLGVWAIAATLSLMLTILVRRLRKFKSKTHVMLDIETFGQRMGCVVRSIGAVHFDPHTGKEFSHFYRALTTEEQLAKGLVIEDDSYRWWSEKGEGDAFRDPRSTELVLRDLCAWFDLLPGNTCVWVNGASFDFPILQHLMDTFAFEPPYHFRSQRCIRSIDELHPFEWPKGHHTHHALEDCRSQIQVLVKSLERL